MSYGREMPTHYERTVCLRYFSTETPVEMTKARRPRDGRKAKLSPSGVCMRVGAAPGNWLKLVADSAPKTPAPWTSITGVAHDL